MGSLKALSILSILCIVVFAQQSYFETYAGLISSRQSHKGGFSFESGGKDTLSATTASVSLSTVYGTTGYISRERLISFLNSLRSGRGYSDSLGKPETLESMLNAIKCYTYLNAKIPEKERLVEIVLSLKDQKSSLFRDKPGEKPTIKATYEAVQILSVLEGKDKFSRLFEYLKSYLSESVGFGEEIKYFQFKDGDNEYQFKDGDNEYQSSSFGILLGDFVGFNFKEEDKILFTNYYMTRITKDGYFFDSKNNTNIYNTYIAMRALNILGYNLEEQFTTTYYKDALKALDLESTYYYSLTLLHSEANSRLISKTQFHSEFISGSGDTEVIVVGSRFRPALEVVYLSMYINSQLDIKLEVTFDGKTDLYSTFFDPENSRYKTKEAFFPTKMDSMKFVFTVENRLLFETFVFKVENMPLVGYKIDVKYEMQIGEKKALSDGNVRVGSNFTFFVSLSVAEESDFTSDYVSVTMSIHDSSHIEQYATGALADRISAPLYLYYSCDSPNIVPGALFFSFKVSDRSRVNSIALSSFKMDTKLYASRIEFEEPISDLSLDDILYVYMTPGFVSDSTEFSPMKLITSQSPLIEIAYNFSLVLSRSGVDFDNIIGKYVAGDNVLSYKFTLPLDLSTDYIGDIEFRFLYTTKNGQIFELTPYGLTPDLDTLRNGNSFRFKVSAILVVELLSEPPKGNFDYGDVIDFNFKILDKVTNKYIYSSSQSRSYPEIIFTDSDGTVADSKKVSSVDDTFNLDFSLGPNLVNGPGLVSIVIKGPGKLNYPVLTPDEKSIWKIPVSISGKIDIDYKVFTSTQPITLLGYISIELSLSHKGKELEFANLIVQIQNIETGENFTIEVFRNLIPSSNFNYSVSWVLPKDEDFSSTYSVSIFRIVDFKHQRDPLLTIPVNYGGPQRLLPFRMESMIMTSILIVFLYFSYHKWTVLVTFNKKKN